MKFILNLIIVLYFFSNSILSLDFIHTNGNKIIDKNGNPIVFNGINLGNWLLWEGYLMMGNFDYKTHTQFFNDLIMVFGNDTSKAKEFEYQWRLHYVDQNVIDDIKKLGFNSVRVPFHYNMFWKDGKYIDDGFEYLDSLIKYCIKDSIYILLDMHAAIGYQNPGDHCDNLESNANQPRESVHFWDGNNVLITAKIWKYIANRYKEQSIIWGYDLLNEPVPQEGREFELLPSLKLIADSIRQVDKNHIIVAEGSWWASDLTKLDWTDFEVLNKTGISKKWDNNLVYETHHYSSDVSLLNSRLSLCNKLNIPIILGEYGENDLNNIREFTDWCIKNSVSFFPWTFKKMFHDKSVWTIEPYNSYKTMINAITSNTIVSETTYNGIINFCKNGITNNSNCVMLDTLFYFSIAKQSPYLNIINKIPGEIEAENFDSPNAYFDLSSGNIGGEYRDSDVDIVKANGGFAVGYIEDGEWLEYTIFSDTSLFFNIDYTISTEKSGKIKLLVDGILLDSIFVPSTGSWDKYVKITQTEKYLSKGRHIIKLLFNGEFNLDKFSFYKSNNSVLENKLHSNKKTAIFYPNPFINKLYLKSYNKGYLYIYDTNGELLFKTYLVNKNNHNNQKISIDVSHLSKGIYIFKFKDDDNCIINTLYK